MRWECKKYRDRSKGKPCQHCGRIDPTVIPHHYIGPMKYRLGGGGSMKSPDWAVMDLCHECHADIHASKPRLWGEDKSEMQLFYALQRLGKYVEEITG